MAIKKENAELRDKIVAGIKKAKEKLIEATAAKNDYLVICVNGEVKKVPAKELLKK